MYKKEQREKIQKVILESLSKGASVVKACQGAGIDFSTFYAWRRKYRRFNRQVLEVFDSRTQVVEDALFKAALGGNVTAQIFWLKNRAPDRWKDRIEQRIQGDEKKPIRIILSHDGKAPSISDKGNEK